jgi:parvulin-like peptidyl-prolyl isomerase
MCFCSACENQGQEVVANIGKQQITKKQLEARIQKYKTAFSHAAPQETVTPAELKRFFLDQIIDETLIAMEGRKRGLAVKEDKQEQLIRKTMIDLGRSISYPSRQEALKYYQRHKKNYLVHKRYETTQILVADEHLAWELKEKIEKHQLSMKEAARKYSIGEEASQGGHLQAMQLNDFLPEIAKIIPRLKPAQLSPVIHSPYGYHLLKLNHILPAGFETFSKVENKVKDELYTLKLRNHFRQWLAEARVRYQVSIQASQLEAANEK